jgi:hypothetical protein
MTDDKQTDKPVSSEPAAIVPVQPVFPTQQGIELPELLAQGLKAKIQAGDLTAIDTIIAIQSKRFDAEQALRQQELSLRKLEPDQKHEVALKQVENVARSAQSTNSNVRWAIGALCSIFALTLLYSGVTKDLASSDKILTLMSGLLGGGGAISAISKKDPPADPKP